MPESERTNLRWKPEEMASIDRARGYASRANYIKHVVLLATGHQTVPTVPNGTNGTKVPIVDACANKEINKRKKRRDKKRPAQAPLEIVDPIIAHLNQRAGTRCVAKGKQTRQLIASRLAEGYTTEDFIRVIDVKCQEWLGGAYQQYLTPKTLFGPKFEQYAGQLPPGKDTDTSRMNSQQRLNQMQAEASEDEWMNTDV
jgi:uncharacterized phage protein (TIGR02220 family)